MTVTYLGSLTIGDALPGGLAAGLAGEAGINGALPDIQARLAALTSFAPLPSDFAVNLTLAESIVSAIQVAITAGIAPPSIDAQIAIVAALVADLEALVASVYEQLTVVTDFLGLLGTGGVHGYVYAGATNGLGGDLTTALTSGFPGGAGTDSANVIVLGTTTPATWSALTSIFKTTP